MQPTNRVSDSGWALAPKNTFRQISSRFEGGRAVVDGVVEEIVTGSLVLVVLTQISQVSGSPGTHLAVDLSKT